MRADKTNVWKSPRYRTSSKPETPKEVMVSKGKEGKEGGGVGNGKGVLGVGNLTEE